MRLMTEAFWNPPKINAVHDYTLDTYSIKDDHYTYDVPDDHGVADLSCPYCADSASLSEIVL